MHKPKLNQKKNVLTQIKPKKRSRKKMYKPKLTQKSKPKKKSTNPN